MRRKVKHKIKKNGFNQIWEDPRFPNWSYWEGTTSAKTNCILRSGQSDRLLHYWTSIESELVSHIGLWCLSWSMSTLNIVCSATNSIMFFSTLIVICLYSVTNTKYRLNIIWHLLLNNLGIVDFTCCKYCHLLSENFHPNCSHLWQYVIYINVKMQDTPNLYLDSWHWMSIFSQTAVLAKWSIRKCVITKIPQQL